MSRTGDTGDGADEERQLITIFRVAQIDPNEDAHLTRDLLQRRKQVTSETGYMMKFAGERHRELTPFDILTLPGKSYPISIPALDTLPPHVRAELDSTGAVKLLGDYNPETGSFEHVSLEWEDKSVIDRVAELVSLGVSETHAFRYVAIEEENSYTKDQWAKIRGVGESAIGNSIRAVEEARRARYDDLAVEDADEVAAEVEEADGKEKDVDQERSRSVMVGNPPAATSDGDDS